MKKVNLSLVIILIGLCLSACTWPKVYVQTSSGYVSYDRINHRFEIMWEAVTKTPADSASTLSVIQK